MRFNSASYALSALLLFLPPVMSSAELRWQHLSSKTGDLPVPGESTQQTGAIVADLDKDGVNDFVLSFRQKGPALVWYRHVTNGWSRYVLDNDFLTVEAGGAVYDIDGDGDLDIVFGGDWQSNELWWWENPYPNFDPNVSWKRHVIKKGGATQHHDQAFGDFKGTGKAQLAFWNQGAKAIFLADIPADPRKAESWVCTEIFSGKAGEGAARYAEGMAACDVDGDGKVDLLAGNYWFKHLGGASFKPIKVAAMGGRIAAGKFKPGKYPQIVIAPGDGIGPLKWYECVGNPEDANAWVGHDLAGRDLIHGHSLQVADIDGDDNLDIFCAEMAKWSENKTEPDNPKATAWIFLGDGQGHFEKVEFSTGIGFHEARVADLNGDGRLDILDKPYNWEAPRVDVWLQMALGQAQTADVLGNARSVPSRYEYRQQHSPDGIGKFYLGREIAHVMGHQAADWLERPTREEEEKTQLLVDSLGVKPGDVVADIGAGTGYFSRRLSKRVGEQGAILAVDIQPEMLDLLTNEMAALNITNVKPILGTITDPKLPSKSVDLVLMVDVYHEFSHPSEMMGGICKSLKSAGRVAFVEFRGEDPEVPIKPLHKMTEGQVRKEMLGQPLEWVETIEVLPRQHILIFKKKNR